LQTSHIWIFQDREDVELLTFYFPILLSAEAIFSALELEFLGVGKALGSLKVLLLGRKLLILVLVDHRNLEQLIKYKTTKLNHMKWLDLWLVSISRLRIFSGVRMSLRTH
jgi:RNase H-like domain found in reverse transcriptase